jgi:metal-responsive CopG/Arc/MetJ family transcriptional regulator
MARRAVTISLPADLVRETGAFCKKESLTLSEMARDALRDYLYSRKMQNARKAFSAHLRKRGLFTEQNLLKTLRD